MKTADEDSIPRYIVSEPGYLGMHKFYRIIVLSALSGFYLGTAPCQADSHLNTQISQQSATAAAETIIQNINIIIQISEGKIDPQSIGGTLLADTESAIRVYQQWQKYNASILNQKISSLKLEISSVQSLFNRTPTAQLDDALSASLKAVDDLEDAQRALLQNARAAGKLGTTLKAIKFLGAGASGFDTILKANDLINAIQDDASNFDKGMAASKAAVSASVTGMAFAGAKLTPLVGTVYVATDVAVWYSGKLGDAVYLETNSRTAAIYNDINGANLRIQNRISALYKSPPPPTDEQVAAIAREEYASVRQFVEGFKEDVGVIEWLFGVNKSSNNAIDDALAMIDYILDNKAEERAISFNNNLREQWDAYNNLLSNLETTTDILGGIESSIPENRLITRSSYLVLDRDDNTAPDEDEDSNQEDETDTSDRTDDEIAAEEEAARIAREEEDARLALERTNQISALEIERTAQFEVKVDREANIANNNDRLAILEHGELETVQNALSLVVSRVNNMRQDLIDGNLSAADQQLFQDLAAYQETLESEIDRINAEITTLTNANQTLQSELDSANITIINNSNQLNALNYDYNNFTEPTFTGTLTDWSNYEYELPLFNETETPVENLVGVFLGVNGTPSSNLAIQGKLGTITETSRGNASFQWPVDECISGCTVTETTPASETSNYQYLSWGTLTQTVRMSDIFTGAVHDIQNMRWLYGEATSSDYLNTRTGSASYAGQIYGDYTEASVTQYNAVTGELGLLFNFSDDSLSGEGYFALNGTPSDTFTVSGGLQTYDGQQYLEADLAGIGTSNTGGLLGAFYGPAADELGGSIWYFGGDYAYGGVFVAQPGTFELPNIGLHTRITSNKVGFGVYDADIGSVNNGAMEILRYPGDGTVTLSETFSTTGYSHLSWGRWVANGSTNADYNEGGYWSSTDSTLLSVTQNRTGRASYSGNIVGDFVSSAGVRDDAQGLININADFSNQSVSGEFQFGHDCGGGSGLSGCNTISRVLSFSELMTDVDRTGLSASGIPGFGDYSSTVRTSGSGILASFAGPNAEEIAGTVWANENGGMYNGVFVAGNGNPPAPFIPSTSTFARVTTNKVGFGVYDSDGGNAGDGNIAIQRDVIGGLLGEAVPTERLAASNFSYSSWGKWSANGTTHPDYSEGGYWVAAEATPGAVVQNRTGTASYSGNIVGDFVSSAGVRDDARGLINIDADFSNQSVSGEFQFGHDCGGGSGPSGCNVISGVASFNEAINDYNGSGFGSHSDTVRTAGSGVVGIFAGPNAEEIAGTAWMNDNGGMYNGVFIAGQ